MGSYDTRSAGFYKCKQCTFSSYSERGLDQHTNRKHTMNTELSTAVTTDVTAPARASAYQLMMNPESMDRIMRMADMMASGKSTIPAHLQKNPADCMAVVIQAMQWGMLPHVVAQKTHVVNGTLGYEAQLVNAVIQESGAITGRFHYEYRGESPQMQCRVGAVIRGENEITWGEWLNEAKVTTKNSPLWKTNPKQQMGYLQVKNWARTYAPGAILGVYTPDEFDMPPPLNMGAAEIVKEEIPKALFDEAEAAAKAGVASYQKFWAATGKANRKLLDAEHAEFKSIASEADQSRTVDTTKTQTNAATGEVTVTFDQVIAKLKKATSEDALYIAMDWGNAMDDQSRMAEVETYFSERLAEIKGE